MFISPWEGRCEFRTSTNGRSLKCRHILDPKSQKFNPAAVAQSIRDAQSMGRSRADELTSALAGAKPVSELRFNLPGTSPSKAGEGAKGKWDPSALHGQFSKLLHLEPRSSDEDEWDEEEPMDLTLGKEDAGGGHRGKRAKLGKLIVHDEGLKMMDLVVAANVGVWWTTWERGF
jgi:NADH dehydrogenase (ubiquinone) Fe-S protein 8